MRRALILCLSLVFSINVMAAPGTVQSQGWVAEFVKKSQLNKKPRLFKDLVNESFADLEPEDAQMMRELAEKFPGWEVPQLNLTKIKNQNGGEDYQFQANANGQSVVLDMAQEGDNVVMKVSGNVGKQTKNWKMSTAEDSTTARANLMAFFREAGFATNDGGFQLLNASDVEKLSLAEKRKYFKKLQDLAAALERLSDANQGPFQTSSLLDLFLLPAYAVDRPADGTVCYKAGYRTQWKDGVCAKDDPKIPTRSGDQIQCNPQIFGSKASYVTLSDPAGRCTQIHDNVIDAFPTSIKNEADFDAAKQQMIAALEDAYSVCSEKKKTGMGKAEISTACGDLSKRMKQLAGMVCGQLKADGKNRFPDLACDRNPTIPVPTKPPGKKSDEGCEGLGGKKADLTCPDDQRVPVDACPKKFRCACGPNEAPVLSPTQYEVGCQAGGPPPGPSGPANPPPDSGRKDKVAGFPWMTAGLVVGAAGLGFLIGYSMKKKKTVYVPGKTKTVTKTITKEVPVPNPIPVPVPVPVPGPTEYQYIPYTPPTKGIQ